MSLKSQTLLLSLVLLSADAQAAKEAPDPFSAYLDGKAPEILREVPVPQVPPENVTVREGEQRQMEFFQIRRRPVGGGT
jgi:hypothetical protein